MADDVPFGALDAVDWEGAKQALSASQAWREREAQQGLALESPPARSWYDTLNAVAHFPQRIGAALMTPQGPTGTPAAFGTQTPQEVAEQPPGAYVSPPVQNVMSAIGGAAKAGWDVASGQTPMVDPATGRTNEKAVQGIFDAASLLGGASVAGTAGRVASDTARAGAALAVAEHAAPFYSGLERAVAAVPQETMSGKQWLNTILNRPGVKAEELDWTGAKDMLAARGDQPVTKTELQDHLDANKVQIGEVEKVPVPSWRELSGDEQYDFMDRHDLRAADAEETYERARTSGRIVDEDFVRYPKETLPGGTNYREKLLTLPGMTKLPEGYRVVPRDQAPAPGFIPIENGYTVVGPGEAQLSSGRTPEEAIANSGKHLGQVEFQSSHWDEPNVLLHLRMNDRDVMGAGETAPQKALHLEEIQSDWHQRGRDYGYRSDRDLPMTTRPMPDNRYGEGIYEALDNRGTVVGRGTGPEGALEAAKGMPSVPDAPFKNTQDWTGLALKRALYEAAEGGYDRLSWTPGAQQAERYDLIKHIKTVRFERAGTSGFTPLDEIEEGDIGGILTARDHNGKKVIEQNIDDPEKQLSDYVGKEVAKKLMEQQPKRAVESGLALSRRELSGLDLKVGGEGMKGYYDKIVPDTLNKIVKPYGARVKQGRMSPEAGQRLVDNDVVRIRQSGDHWEVVNDVDGSLEQRFNTREEAIEHASAINDTYRSGFPVHYVDITPQLRQQLLTKGMPLFEDTEAGAAVSTAAHITGGTNVPGATGPVPTKPGRTPRAERGAPGLEEAQRASARAAGAIEPLPGLPQKPLVVNGEPYIPGPIERIHRVAQDYMASTGRPYERLDKFYPLDKEHATAIAQAFDDMKHEPENPRVKASYEALANESKAQYQFIKKSGLKVEPIAPDQPDPYAENPRLAAKDVAENNHLWFFPTESGFGSTEAGFVKGAQSNVHPMLQPSGETLNGRPLLYNDLFRIVHDYFGHLKEGNGFRATGEDNAWRTHSLMYSDLAKPAMTSETRGQNSWVNYGPYGEANRKASAADTVYSEQKVGLMPDWTMRDRVLSDTKAGKGVAVASKLFDKEGNPIQGKDYAKASRAVLDAIEGGPKGAGPLDLSSMKQIPGVEQRPMDRLVPPRGVSQRLQDALKNQNVIRGIQRSIDRGMGVSDWYHNEPLRRAFVGELGEDEGTKAFREFADMVSATSPRSDVPINIRNASYYYMHARQGEPLPEELPYPYGHVAQNLHRQNFETLTGARPGALSAGATETGTGWDIYKNPKPASFSQNLQGNLEPGTIDTHAFRNIAMRTKDPAFLETSLSRVYKAGNDPKVDSLVKRYGEVRRRGDKMIVTFRPQQLYERGKLTMEDALKIPTFWTSKPNPSEYAAAEELYHRLGKKKGLPTADTQAAAWAGAGEMTGLGTVGTHTFPELFNERVLYTARMRGEDPRKTLRDFIRGEKPLLSAPVPFGALDQRQQ